MSDIAFLYKRKAQHQADEPQWAVVEARNERWAQERLREEWPDLDGWVLVEWGLVRSKASCFISVMGKPGDI